MEKLLLLRLLKNWKNLDFSRMNIHFFSVIALLNPATEESVTKITISSLKSGLYQMRNLKKHRVPWWKIFEKSYCKHFNSTGIASNMQNWAFHWIRELHFGFIWPIWAKMNFLLKKKNRWNNFVLSLSYKLINFSRKFLLKLPTHR